ncbi:OsmC family protein [Halomonas sp. MCCC 1A17488]|uniref:OsmC family protein n=1 Tax=Billgrantia sulfidoxydans TaxID=2733484 RepID=A0ABX7W539_9GAMM|nr:MULTISPECIES: OsmC family protein [Halomonas]MCE8016313.1 OsmC family protein [Halomonas sp. MCCC 1A17488]MCG3239646.1 OsmC family protein [Halomonas sp. MCCC 1A17488]QPP50442.1 OsmC family protein [Halomonas sp. SS10-MC5]QTP54059.1 OsmC family protein [Halomonas sulfidoxydans]
MKASVKWTDGRQFVAESGSGHSVVIDGPPDHGGRNTGPRPMEMLLMGMGACTSFDVLEILEKSRAGVTDCVATVEAERADAVPSVFTRIHVHFTVSGHNLKESQVKRAVELSAEKYCSASIMLAKGGVEVTHSYSIVDD